MSVRPEGEAPPLPRPDPKLLDWTFFDDVMIEGPFGPTPGQRWRSVGLVVLASVDWRPMPRGWYYHLSVSIGNCSTPPSEEAIARVVRAFKLDDPERIAGRTSPNIIHLYTRAPS
jgi:hypothetical protein